MKHTQILKTLSVLSLAGGLASACFPLQSLAAPVYKRDLFKELGLGTFINAAGYFTSLSGSLRDCNKQRWYNKGFHCNA